jgi:predicted TIM-barrel fold metal-dependent hydrolase
VTRRGSRPGSPIRRSFDLGDLRGALAASYSRVCEVAQAACSGLSGPERAAVLAGNARAIYRAHCPQRT